MSQLFAVTDAGGRGTAGFNFIRSTTFDAGGATVEFFVSDSLLKQLRTP